MALAARKGDIRYIAYGRLIALPENVKLLAKSRISFGRTKKKYYLCIGFVIKRVLLLINIRLWPIQPNILFTSKNA